MKRLLPLIMLLLAGCTTTSYFPAGSVDDPNNESNWHGEYYSKALHNFGESRLLPPNQKKIETYRFLWLRTFHHPIVFTLEVPKEGRATLTTKVASGKSAYRFGAVFKNERKKLESEATKELKDSIVESAFWSSEITRWNSDEEGMDGAEWVIEAWKDGNYHVLTDWSPEKGPVWIIGSKLIEKSGIKFGEDEIY